MEEIRLKTASGEFVLNNNSEKYTRALKDAGRNASPEEVLAHYDKLQGLIKDTNGNEIKNGPFWEAYTRWEEELPKLTEVLDEREKALDEGEDRVIAANSLNVEHKRSFLGTLMTISVAAIAGLFIFISNSETASGCVKLLAKASGLGYACFILASSTWLTAILSQENTVISKKLKFLRDSKADFINKVGVEIISLKTYEDYRKIKNQEETTLEKPILGDSEAWFWGICMIFAISSLPLLFIFVLS